MDDLRFEKMILAMAIAIAIILATLIVVTSVYKNKQATTITNPVTQCFFQAANTDRFEVCERVATKIGASN